MRIRFENIRYSARLSLVFQGSSFPNRTLISIIIENTYLCCGSTNCDRQWKPFKRFFKLCCNKVTNIFPACVANVCRVCHTCGVPQNLDGHSTTLVLVCGCLLEHFRFGVGLSVSNPDCVCCRNGMTINWSGTRRTMAGWTRFTSRRNTSGCRTSCFITSGYDVIENYWLSLSVPVGKSSDLENAVQGTMKILSLTPHAKIRS